MAGRHQLRFFSYYFQWEKTEEQRDHSNPKLVETVTTNLFQGFARQRDALLVMCVCEFGNVSGKNPLS